MRAAVLRVEVVHCPAAGEVDRVRLELPTGSRVHEALAASGLLERHAAAEGAPLAVGVWGRRCAPERTLVDGDRVELYRALQVDPMEARRLRQRRQGGKRASR